MRKHMMNPSTGSAGTCGLSEGNQTATRSDAYNRMADCYFVQTDYTQAIEYYNRSIESGKADVDYAMFQKGFTLGLAGQDPGEGRCSEPAYQRASPDPILWMMHSLRLEEAMWC